MKKCVMPLIATIVSFLLAGCSGGSALPKSVESDEVALTRSIEAGGMTVSYPESWGDPEVYPVYYPLGLEMSNVPVLKPIGMAANTVIFVGDASGSYVEVDALKNRIVDQAGVLSAGRQYELQQVENARVDGKDVLKIVRVIRAGHDTEGLPDAQAQALRDIDGSKDVLVIAHDGEMVTSILAATINASDYGADPETYDAVINSIRFS